jgi:prophage DNA circulation protein
VIRKKRIKKASYNGVAFFLQANETVGGRRIVVHEFPYSNIPATEDLGLKPKQWAIEGFIFGALYKEQSQALQDALEKDGVGALNHPYLGKNLKVRCLNYRRAEYNRELGFVLFSMIFIEAGELPISATKLPDSGGSSLLQKVLNGFTDEVKDAAGLLSDTSDTINAFCESIEDGMAPWLSLREQIGNVTQSISILKEMTQEVTTEPISLFYAVSGLVDAIIHLPIPVIAQLAMLTTSYGSIIQSIEAVSGPARDIPLGTQAVNPSYPLVVKEMIASVLIIKISELLTQDVSTINPAQKSKWGSIALSQCDKFLNDTTSQNHFEAVSEVKAQLVVSLNEKQEKNIGIKLPHEINSILLAHQLFGNLSKETELLAINQIKDPAFIPAGLEVTLP